MHSLLYENNDLEWIIQIITKIYIIINATKLGWFVEIENGNIVLSKKIINLTQLDKNTPRLINRLISKI